LSALATIERDRLLHVDVLARGRGLEHLLLVLGMGRRQHDRIDIGVS